MKLKTCDLTNQALNYLVGTIERADVFIDGGYTVFKTLFGEFRYEPTTNWTQGGPIIEQNRITVGPSVTHKQFQAYGDTGCYALPRPRHTQSGPTPLIAAMRCFVASKLGDEVEVPDELFQ